jgi:predicted phage terminase large subunit-like protein
MVQTAKLDARAWNALYQQDPVPDSGDFFERDMFQEYEVLPKNLHIYAASDYAVSEGGGDYTEHGIFGLDAQGDLYVIDWWRKQAASNEWIESQCDLIAQYQPLIWFGESGPIRKAIEPFLKRRMEERQTFCRLEWLSSVADKVVRARSIQARASMGKVWLPKRSTWNADLISQLMRFPAGKYDDGVDVMSLMGRGLQMTQTPKVQAPPKPIAAMNRSQGWMG